MIVYSSKGQISLVIPIAMQAYFLPHTITYLNQYLYIPKSVPLLTYTSTFTYLYLYLYLPYTCTFTYPIPAPLPTLYSYLLHAHTYPTSLSLLFPLLYSSKYYLPCIP